MQVWWVLITCTLCALPFTIWEFKQQEYSGRYVGERRFLPSRPFCPLLSHATVVLLCADGDVGAAGWVVAGIFVILTLPISIYQVRRTGFSATGSRFMRLLVSPVSSMRAIQHDCSPNACLTMAGWSALDQGLVGHVSVL